MRVGAKRTPRGVPVVGGGSGGGGGGTDTNGVQVYKKTLTVGDGTGGTYTPAQLAAGVSLFTPAVGDVIANLGYQFVTAYDGTAAVLDFVSGTTEILRAVFGTGNLPNVRNSNAAVGSLSQAVDGSLSIQDYVGYAGYIGYPTTLRVDSADPIKVVISQDGTLGGTAIDSTTGTVVVYVTVHPAAQMVDLDA